MSRPRRDVVTITLAVVHASSLVALIAFVTSYAGTTVLRPLMLMFLVLAGVAAVAWPGSGAGLVVLVGVVVGYGVVTGLGEALEFADRPTALQVLMLAGCLYIAHATDALRGAVDGALVDRSVLLRWLQRLAQALLPGLGVGVVVMALPAGDSGGPLWLVGAVALLVATGLPALRVARRPWRQAGTGPGTALGRPRAVPSRFDS